jgi:hypothetical protein
MELNFHPLVLKALPFISFPRSAFDKTYLALLQRDNSVNSLGPSGMADRHKEVQVRANAEGKLLHCVNAEHPYLFSVCLGCKPMIRVPS